MVVTADPGPATGVSPHTIVGIVVFLVLFVVVAFSFYNLNRIHNFFDNLRTHHRNEVAHPDRSLRTRIRHRIALFALSIICGVLDAVHTLRRPITAPPTTNPGYQQYQQHQQHQQYQQYQQYQQRRSSPSRPRYSGTGPSSRAPSPAPLLPVARTRPPSLLVSDCSNDGGPLESYEMHERMRVPLIITSPYLVPGSFSPPPPPPPPPPSASSSSRLWAPAHMSEVHPYKVSPC